MQKWPNVKIKNNEWDLNRNRCLVRYIICVQLNLKNNTKFDIKSSFLKTRSDPMTFFGLDLWSIGLTPSDFFCRSIDWFAKNFMASKITIKFLNSRPDENKIQSRTPNYFNRCSAPALSVYVSSILYYMYIGYHVLSQITHVVLSIEQWTHDARRSIEHGRLSHTATQDHWT